MAAQEIAHNRVFAPSQIKEAPTDEDIEAFQSQLSVESIKHLATNFINEHTKLDAHINLKSFKNTLAKTFEKKPHDRLILAMFERFKPFKLEGERERIHAKDETVVDFKDFILAMNLLARIYKPLKLKLLFELCDDDQDGCMMPEDILNML